MSRTQQEIATPDTVKQRKVRSQPKFGTTKWLTYAAVFAALALVIKLIGQLTTVNDSFKITLIYTAWLCAAAVLGPVGGGAVCFISDVLGALILPTGPINPLLTVGCTLYGVIAGLCFKIPRSNVVRFIVAGVTCTLVVSLIFDSFAIWVWCKYVLGLGSFLDRTLAVYVGMRLGQTLISTVNIPITLAIMPLLNRLGLLPPTSKTTVKTH